MTHHGLLRFSVLKPAFSNGRTVCDIKRIIIFSVVPTQLNYLKLAAGRYHGLCQSQDVDVSLPTTAIVPGPKKKKGGNTFKKGQRKYTKQESQILFIK